MNLGKKMFKTINTLNNSKYFAGIAMLILNIGTKYICICVLFEEKIILKYLIIKIYFDIVHIFFFFYHIKFKI